MGILILLKSYEAVNRKVLILELILLCETLNSDYGNKHSKQS